ncbi:MAG TPA: flagellar biosynthesis anti-sigma factor FlgM [Planctomycetota bacterium]|nr:flagellar biosynthesis anti-sigma factor FlgM [Planctomycetota bacterium]
MKIRGPAGVGGADPIRSAGPLRAKTVKGTSSASRADSVEISEMAKFLEKISRLPDIRKDKVDAVKAQLANGSYETPEKLEKAINALLDDLW